MTLCMSYCNLDHVVYLQVPGTQNEVSSLSSMLSAASNKVLTPEEIKLSNYILNTLIEAQLSNNMIYSVVRANEVTEVIKI